MSVINLLISQPLGDMKRPVCGLCRRIGSKCTFPLRQKPQKLRCRSKRAPDVTDIHEPSSECSNQRERRRTPADASGVGNYHCLNIELSGHVSDDDIPGRYASILPLSTDLDGSSQGVKLQRNRVRRRRRSRFLRDRVQIVQTQFQLSL